MANRKRLGELLPEEAKKPVIKRGQGIRLSTEAQAENGQGDTATSTNVETEKSPFEEIEKGRKVGKKTHGVERVKPGYEVRRDLLLAVKRLALDEDRFNYEIVEEALEEYLRKKGRL